MPSSDRTRVNGNDVAGRRNGHGPGTLPSVDDFILKEVRRVALHAWRPPPDADAAEVRRLGWKLLRIGLVMLALGIVPAFGLKSAEAPIADFSPWLAAQIPTITMFAVAPGFFAVVIGGYRGILGTDPETDESSGGTRVAVGVAVGCGALVFVTVAVLAVYALAKAFR